MKINVPALLALSLPGAAWAKLANPTSKICHCDEESGLCGKIEKPSDSIAKFLEKSELDFEMVEGAEVGCCLDGCESNCGGQRKLDSNKMAVCHCPKDGECETLFVSERAIFTRGHGKHENDYEGPCIDPPPCDLDAICFQGNPCFNCTACEAAGGGCLAAPPPPICEEVSEFCDCANTDCFDLTACTDAGEEPYNCGGRDLDEGGDEGKRRLRKLCINMECCADLRGGAPQCVPEGTCKLIHAKYLKKDLYL